MISIKNIFSCDFVFINPFRGKNYLLPHSPLYLPLFRDHRVELLMELVFIFRRNDLF